MRELQVSSYYSFVLTTIVASPARLLPSSTKYVCPAGFGFRLDEDVLHKQSKALAPPPDLDSDDDDSDSDDEEPLGLSKLISKLQYAANDIFPKYDARVVCGSACPSNHGEENRYPLEEIFLVLFKCTRRDDRFIPSPEPLQKLKETLAKEGFVAEPCWLIVHT